MLDLATPPPSIMSKCARKIVQAHSRLWKEKSREEQQEWAARARELHEEKSEQVYGQIASEVQSLRKLEQEEQKEQ